MQHALARRPLSPQQTHTPSYSLTCVLCAALGALQSSVANWYKEEFRAPGYELSDGRMASFWKHIVRWSEHDVRLTGRKRLSMLGGGVRPPPLPPATFENLLQHKTFASPHVDHDFVARTYEYAMTTGFSRRRRMVFKSQGWRPGEMQTFCQTVRDPCLLGCPRVQVLELSDNPLGDEGLAELAAVLRDGLMPALGIISLSMCKGGDAGLAALAVAFQATPRPSLHTLYMHSNQFSDDGVEALARALPATPAVTQLCLMKNQVGVRGQLALAAALRHVPHLERIHLNDNSGLGSQQRKDVLEAMQAHHFRPERRDDPCGTVWRRAKGRGGAPPPPPASQARPSFVG